MFKHWKGRRNGGIMIMKEIESQDGRRTKNSGRLHMWEEDTEDGSKIRERTCMGEEIRERHGR